RNGRAGDGLQHRTHSRMQARQSTVDRPRHLWMCSREIADELIISDGDLNTYREGSIANAVIIDPVLCLVDSSGQLCHLKTSHALAVVEQGLYRVLNYIEPVLIAQFLETPLAQAQRGRLGIHISQGHVRQAHIGCNQVDQTLDGSSLFIEFDAWKLQSLLEHLGGIGGP